MIASLDFAREQYRGNDDLGRTRVWVVRAHDRRSRKDPMGTANAKLGKQLDNRVRRILKRGYGCALADGGRSESLDLTMLSMGIFEVTIGIAK